MIRLRRILCPVDFSESSRHALDHAVVLARWYEAELVVLHARPPIPPVYGLGVSGGASMDRAATDTLTGDLRGFLGTVEGVKTEALVRPGPAAAVILDGAVELDADLLVLGTHGRSGFERFLLGSVTEKVLRKASCPVLTVPPRAPHAPERPVFERILCGVDFGEASLRAAAFSFSLAQEAAGSLTLLHVVDAMLPAAWFVAHPHPEVGEYRRRMADEARRRLDEMVPDGVNEWCDTETRLACGKAHVEILRAAEDMHADLIALGVHGRRGAVDRMVFGSTTQHMVRQAVCPVLTTRP